MLLAVLQLFAGVMRKMRKAFSSLMLHGVFKRLREAAVKHLPEKVKVRTTGAVPADEELHRERLFDLIFGPKGTQC